MLVRVFQYFMDGVPQISAFPEEPPPGRFDLEVRIKHFTEIENFTLLADLLARQIDDGVLRPIETLDGINITDSAVAADVARIKAQDWTSARLGALILDRGLNWEHFVASFNANMVPGLPLEVDAVVNGIP